MKETFYKRMVQTKSGFHHEEREENKFISSGKENMFNTSTFPPDKVSLSSLRKYYCILSETFLVFIRESAKLFKFSQLEHYHEKLKV